MLNKALALFQRFHVNIMLNNFYLYDKIKTVFLCGSGAYRHCSLSVAAVSVVRHMPSGPGLLRERDIELVAGVIS